MKQLQWKQPKFRLWQAENKFFSIPPEKQDALIDALSEEEIKAFLEDEKAVEAENQTMVVEFRKQFDIIRKNLLTFLDAGSSEYKYVNKLSPWTSPPSYRYKDLLVESREKRAWSKKQKEVLAKIEANASSLRDEAISLLIEKGMKYGVDFNADNAIAIATQLIFEEKTSEYENNDEMVDIDHCCEECGKWDGVSHRCSCGNRRMYWEYEGNFKDMYIYPQAN